MGKKIEDSDRTIRPHIIKANDYSNIELISEVALARSPFHYGNQVINVRKYNQEGEEFYNFTDSSSYEQAVKANYPIRYDNVGGISVYYTPNSHKKEAKSYSVKYDSIGNYISTNKIDSSIVITLDTLQRYLISGFENYDVGVFCYGTHHSVKGATEKLSAYILKLNNKDEIIWRKKIILENAYFTIQDMFVLPNSNLIVSGLKGDNTGWVYKISSDGEIMWETKLGTSNYIANASKIIQNLTGDIIVVGAANNISNDADSDYYWAKLNISGEILWQYKEGTPLDDRLTDIVEYEKDKYYFSGIRTTIAILHRFEDPDVSVQEHNTAPEVNVLEFSDYYDIENNRLYDKAELVSIRGKVLKSMDISDKFNFQVQKDNYYRGVFFLRLSGKEGTLVKKADLLKELVITKKAVNFPIEFYSLNIFFI